MSLSLKDQNKQLIKMISAKFLYTLTLSAISIVIALMLLIPHHMTFRHYPVDFLMCIGWFVSFAFLLMEFNGTICEKDPRELETLLQGGGCNSGRAAFGFAFLAGCFWLGTTIIGSWVTWREKKLKRRTVHTISTPG